MLSYTVVISFLLQSLTEDVKSLLMSASVWTWTPMKYKRCERLFASESVAFAAPLHATLTPSTTTTPHFSSLPVCPSVFLSATHTHTHSRLCLVFKSIHHPSEWDLPPERVNNVWQRDREAYRTEDSLASISILSVSEGNRERGRERRRGWWDSLPQLTASPLLNIVEFKGPESLFFSLSLSVSLYFTFWLIIIYDRTRFSQGEKL